MKTAMQTLISKIETEINKEGNGAVAIGFDSGLKKAKQLAEELLEIEEEQIIEFAKKCLQKALESDILMAYNQVEQYYNETFKQQEQ